LDTTAVVVLIVLALLVLGGVVFAFSRRKQTEHLRERFGPEYERAAEELGSQRKAEAELRNREKRVDKLEIRPLNPADHDRFASAWRSVQAHFVDDPSAAVRDAEDLVKKVMQARGYPVSHFEQRSADISVDHPRVVENYRAARDIADRNGQGKASTEDMRQAMVHYRILFEDLLEVAQPAHQEVRR
jgi:hypothetical protein